MLVNRVRVAATTVPSRRGWAETALVGLVIGGIGYALGRSTGLFTPGRARTDNLLGTALLTLIAPALGEELVFRAAMIPSRSEQKHAGADAALATSAFTLWHVLEARTFLRAAAPIFLRRDFLFLAALEGAACAFLLRRTGSVWPGVVLHWAEVMAWKVWLGGPTLGQLSAQPRAGSSRRRRSAMAA